MEWTPPPLLLCLTVWTRRDGTFPDDQRPIRVKWFKHRGPGDVAFNQVETEVRREDWSAREGGAAAFIDATLSEPGSYVLRVLAYNTVGELSNEVGPPNSSRRGSHDT